MLKHFDQRKTLTIVGLVCCAGAGLFAQSAVRAQGFDVASIKPADPSARGTTIQSAPGGRFRALAITVKGLIQQAYDVREFQISGAPGWADSIKYDITAKVDDPSVDAGLPDDPGKLNAMQRQKFQEHQRQRLQALLAERFQLKLHRETREMGVYTLAVAKDGPKLKESKADDPPIEGFNGPGARRGQAMRMGRGQFTAQMVPIQFLEQALSQQLGRTVIDKTGLTGNYDFTLQWTPDQALSGGFAGEPKDSASAPDTGPSIFTAIQEQLGLRLESQKGPVDILVIDRVEQPSEN
jgi:bla regulator protein BlaR1